MTASPAIVTEKPTRKLRRAANDAAGLERTLAAMAGRERDERDGKKPI